MDDQTMSEYEEQSSIEKLDESYEELVKLRSLIFSKSLQNITKINLKINTSRYNSPRPTKAKEENKESLDEKTTRKTKKKCMKKIPTEKLQKLNRIYMRTPTVSRKPPQKQAKTHLVRCLTPKPKPKLRKLVVNNNP